MSKKNFVFYLGICLLALITLTFSGCGSSGTTGSAGSVVWTEVKDGTGTAIASGGSTTNRTVTVKGYIQTESGHALGGRAYDSVTSASLYNNGEKITYLQVTGEGAGKYSFQTTVELLSNASNNLVIHFSTEGWPGDNIGSAYVVNCSASQVQIHVQLSWSTNGTDVDLHFIKPGGTFAVTPATDSGDCGYSNKTPDWNGNGIRNEANGGAINDPQDPALDVDNTSGYGPENTVIQTPPDGTYTVKVYYYSDHGHGATVPTLKIWINGTLTKTYTLSATYNDNANWTPCTVTVSGGSCTVTDVGTLSAVNGVEALEKK